MKLLPIVVLIFTMVSPNHPPHGVAYARRFEFLHPRPALSLVDHELVGRSRAGFGWFQLPDKLELSDPPVNLSQVAQDEDGRREEPPMGQVLRGVELCLDTETSSGFVLARDSVPRHMLDAAFDVLAVLGWRPIEDDEGVEPYEFADGSLGVQVWLYRMARPVESILEDVKAANGYPQTGRGAGTRRHVAA